MTTDAHELPFSRAEYDDRLRRMRRAMADADVAFAIITAPDTMAWLTGYRSRWYRQHTSTSMPPAQCIVVHVEEGHPFIIDAGYHEELARTSTVLDDIRTLPTSSETHEATLDDYVSFLAEQLRPWAGGRVGLERWSCIPSPAVADVVDAMLEGLGCRVVDVTLPFRGIRRLKSPAELAKIELAQAACDAGIRAILAEATPETTELEAWALYSLGMVRAGGEPAVLHETVAAGSSVSALHRLSGRTRLGSGPVVHPDMASAVDGYHARATRPLMFGGVSDESRRQITIAAGAYEVVASHGTVGASWRGLLAELRRYFASAGVSPGAEGGVGGYELGLSVAPGDWVGEFAWAMNDERDDVIEAGLVTNFESWTSLILVDTVVFEASGPRFLSSLPRDVLEFA
ncbi:M24 family metallopeptidase [Agromyces sp. NPDC058104]|uniref:M24 family metallopeptidase n=1 Tax=Agromyces sp. NPDC058104 TaxID=3346342 RepID=UPI0036DBBE93